MADAVKTNVTTTKTAVWVHSSGKRKAK